MCVCVLLDDASQTIRWRLDIGLHRSSIGRGACGQMQDHDFLPMDEDTPIVSKSTYMYHPVPKHNNLLDWILVHKWWLYFGTDWYWFRVNETFWYYTATTNEGCFLPLNPRKLLRVMCKTNRNYCNPNPNPKPSANQIGPMNHWWALSPFSRT